MLNKGRSLKSLVKGIWVRTITIIIPFTFPSQITTILHRLRGVNIGKGSKISRTAYIDDSDPHLVHIGRNVWITAGVIILCHQRDLANYKTGQAIMHYPMKKAAVKIKSGAHVGVGAIIMPGVTIGKESVIGAGSVVTRDIPDNSIAVGSPAKVIKSFVR